MNSAQAKRVPLRRLLASLGFQPKRQDRVRGELWYLSPFRQETTASFKVQEAKNLWYDFGLPGGGNVIDFATAYFHVDFTAALRKIAAIEGASLPSTKTGDWEAVSFVSAPSSEAGAPLLQTLRNRSLIAYLARRGIPAEIARPYVQEIRYQRNGKPYFALAFPNTSGGYELRNPYFKGTCAPKDISRIEGNDLATVALFEGFMDFLTALAWGVLGDPRASVIVVNSASLRERALVAIRSTEVRTVELYFDHDSTGHELTAYFREQIGSLSVVDCSDQYSGYKDLNDWAAGKVRADLPSLSAEC